MQGGEEKLVEKVMKHEKGKYYVNKQVIIDPHVSEFILLDNIVGPSNVGGIDISSLVIFDTVRLENIGITRILASSSSFEKKFIMFE